MLHFSRKAQLPQHRHDGLLQPVAGRTAGAQDLDAQPAPFLFHLLAQGLFKFPQEGPFILLLSGGGNVVPGLEQGKQGLGDLFLRALPPGFGLFNGGFQAGDADPESAERNLGDILVGHGL